MYTIPSNIKVISYDIWNTLIRGNKAFAPARMTCLIEELNLEVDPAELLAAYRTADKQLDLASDTTGNDFGLADRVEIMSDLLDLGLGRLDHVTVARLQHKLGELRRCPEYMPSLIEPDLVRTLEAQAHAGYRLALVSNTGMDNGTAMRPTLDSLGILGQVTQALFSSDEGVAKPNPLIYQRLCDLMQVEPHEILHIGDNVRADYKGARAAGCQALVFAPGGSELPHITTMKDLILRASVTNGG